MQQKLATVPESEGEEMSSEGEVDDMASSLLSDNSHADLHDHDLVSHGKRREGSIASTYWRPERTDRTEMSSVLDDRCLPNGTKLEGCGRTLPCCSPLHSRLL